MSENILDRAKRVEYPDSALRILPELIAEVEANQIMLRQFQVHEDQTHAAMEGLLGNSDNFIELAREMKEEVGRLRSLNESLMENGNDLRTRCQKAESDVKYLQDCFDLKVRSDWQQLTLYTERLEAAFLRSNAAMRYYQEENRGPWPQVGEQFKEPYIQKARDALEELRHG